MFTTNSGRAPFRSLITRQKVVAGPYAEPMSVAEAKLQTRQGADVRSEDAVIEGYIADACRRVEVDTLRAMLWQRRTLTLDEWPDVIELYACPVREVESITYVDTSGNTQTVAETVYRVRTDLEPATITLKNAQVWPEYLFESGSIVITFTCGYAVPFTVDTTTNTLTFTGYEPTNGERFQIGNSGGLIPAPLVAKRDYYVVGSSGSTCQLSLTSGGAAIDITTPGTGLNFLGEVHPSAMQAMRKAVAVSYADREGSAAAQACEDSYFASLRPIKYTFC